MNRVHGGMNYVSLRKRWSERYHIPLSQQLVVSQNQTGCRFYDDFKNEKMASLKLREFPPMSRLLLFDKRNVIQMDAVTDTPKVMARCNEKEQRIVMLKWFDIYYQEVVPLQFVMANHDQMTVARLIKYIESEFVATTSVQRQWRECVLRDFERMDRSAPNVTKLRVHRERTSRVVVDEDSDRKVPWWGICIFQLNTDHPVFRKRRFASIAEKYALLRQ